MLKWAYIPYTLPLILAGIVALALSVFAARHRRLRGAQAFVWFCLAAAEWTITYALEINSTDLQAKIFWARIEYLGITLGPLCWLAFTVYYTGREARLSRWVWALLGVIPLTTLVLMFTNDAHGLVWRSISLDTSGPFPTLYPVYGVWFWVHTAYSYLCVLVGSVLLLTGLVDARQFYRRQRLALLVGIATPWIGNILYITKLGPVPGLDITPFASTITAIFVALALFSFRLLDLVPVARRAMMDSMSDAVIALDTQNRVLDLNKAAGRMIGMAPGTAIGRTAGQIFGNHGDLLERFRDVREGRTEIVRKTASGDLRHFELQISPLRDVVGEFSGRLVTLHDITERKRAQEEIQTLNVELEARVLARTAELAAANLAKEENLRREQAARQDLAFLAEASRILAGSLDETKTLTNLAHHIVPYLADGCTIHVVGEAGLPRLAAARHSDAAKARLLTDMDQRYPADYQAPRGFPNLADDGKPDFHPSVSQEDLVSMARDEQHLALLCALEIRSYICVPLVGRERTLGAITLLRSEPGQEYTPTSLALAQDLAQRTALAVDNAQLYLAAHRAVQVRDEFLTVASHELKTPLTSLLLALNMLQRSTHNGKIPAADYLARRLTIVEDQSKRLNHLVSNLLDISRMTDGRLQLEPRSADLAALVRSTVAQFHDELAEARCELTLEAGTRVQGYWDPARMEQVVTNLLTNAMKYGRGHPVTVAVSADGPVAHLVVTDQGIGIAPEHLERIFGRFERAVPPGKYSGMGMGLYIARQIVEAHGGSIVATSTPKEGTTFTVTLPIVPD